MITMRIPREKDKEKLVMFLNENEISIELDSDVMNNSMIVEEGKNLIGYSNYVFNDSICEIQTVFVQPEYRRKKIGDGLIRALLNLACKREIKEVYIAVDEKNMGFINYVGLDKVSRSTYKVDLPDFFDRPCRGSKTK